MYVLKEDPPHIVQEALKEYEPLAQKILFHRGVTDTHAAEAFLSREYEENIQDPFSFHDMEKAVQRVLRALREGEMIGIYSDYDCDGVPGAALLHSFLTSLGHTRLATVIPDRVGDGFGLHTHRLDELLTQGATVILTVDCGSVHHRQVAYAQERGADVIVLDHHLTDTPSPAFATINPHVEEALTEYAPCGTGLAYKLVQAIVRTPALQDITPYKPGQEKWLLDLVGLATIADMVPLTKENRIFAHYGLLVMKKTRRIGLQALLQILRIPAHRLKFDDLSFMIIPRINAASRMGNARLAFDLLTTTDAAKAQQLASTLQTLNDKRKGAVSAMHREANTMLKGRTLNGSVLVIGKEHWSIPLVGLLAQKLMEQTGHTVFVWGRDTKGLLRGSCRSRTHNTVLLMQRSEKLFSEYGGHSGAGGFSFKSGMVHIAEETLASHVEEDTQDTPPVSFDAYITIPQARQSLTRILEPFMPFGTGNEKPLFALRDMTIASVQRFGKHSAHTKYLFSDGSDTIEGVSFFSRPVKDEGEQCAVYGYIDTGMRGTTVITIHSVQ